MFDLKGYVVKQAINFKVIGSYRGIVELKCDFIIKFLKGYHQYNSLVYKSLKILSPIDKVDFDYDKDIITIKYDHLLTNEKRIVKWTEVVIDTFMSNYSEIKNSLEDTGNIDETFKILEGQLKNKTKFL